MQNYLQLSRATDVSNILDFLKGRGTFDLPRLNNGLFPAAALQSQAEYTGYQNVWVRDNIYGAYAHYAAGQIKIAQQNVETLLTYFRKYRWRFENIITGKANPVDRMQRPHIRFDGMGLEEIEEQWAHAQNDALGYFLWFYCKLVNENIIDLTLEDLEILCLFALYFQGIQYWQDKDNGHWEEARKIEASSIGTVLAGLRQLYQVLQNIPNWEDKIFLGLTLHQLEELIECGAVALSEILPAECIQPQQKRDCDGALLFLIYPLQVVGDEMAAVIINNVRETLQGEIGIRRYEGDSFWCADYKQKFKENERTIDFSQNMEVRDRALNSGEEAQWCIFDPIVSIIFGQRYQRYKNLRDRDLQIHYLNRSLRQLTAENSPFGAYKCPELYYLENGRYVPNDSTPLLWTQANLWLALHQAL
ncbi:MAG: glycoside hydrolase family 15 protein [Spirulinaceae cyanobacterium]